MIDSKSWVAGLSCGALFLLQGCAVGPSAPLPSQGGFMVVLRGTPRALSAFDAVDVCKKIEASGAEQVRSEKDFAERVYDCPSGASAKEVDDRLHKFVAAYAVALGKAKGDAAASSGAWRMNVKLGEVAQASGSANEGTAAVEMIFTTGTTCKSMSCYGGTPKMWVFPTPYCSEQCPF